MSEKHILYDSYEAAKYVTNIKGWMDSKNRFWGENEHGARWSGCTHIICPNCGEPTQKIYTICDECRAKKAIQRYEAKERKQWDGKVPLYSEVADEYFFNEDELRGYLDDHECTVESLYLIICEPIYLREVGEDFFYDDLPDDEDISP
ncbi:MAG: hypothetical protein JRI41_06050, partial [Deltaproteobacteria bacterium]|nr:hypothetical protein [Deltaproteobacteria bacterium]